MTNRKLTLKSCAVRGPVGRSAYDAAAAAGYTGTEEEYNAILAALPDTLSTLSTYNGRVDAILEYMANQIANLELNMPPIVFNLTGNGFPAAIAQDQQTKVTKASQALAAGTHTVFAKVLQNSDQRLPASFTVEMTHTGIDASTNKLVMLGVSSWLYYDGDAQEYRTNLCTVSVNVSDMTWEMGIQNIKSEE